MALKRTSTAVWHGTGPKGSGTISTLSGAIKDTPYSVNTRFTSEDGKAGTNPEELIAAAHAGCFSMALSGELGRAGYEPESVETTAKVHIDKVDAGFKITRIELETEARVPGIDESEFQQQAEAAKENCPVSQALAGADISLSARLA
jgi:osmotically inducible protein OsmC